MMDVAEKFVWKRHTVTRTCKEEEAGNEKGVTIADVNVEDDSLRTKWINNVNGRCEQIQRDSEEHQRHATER